MTVPSDPATGLDICPLPSQQGHRQSPLLALLCSPCVLLRKCQQFTTSSSGPMIPLPANLLRTSKLHSGGSLPQPGPHHPRTCPSKHVTQVPATADASPQRRHHTQPASGALPLPLCPLHLDPLLLSPTCLGVPALDWPRAIPPRSSLGRQGGPRLPQAIFGSSTPHLPVSRAASL